MVLHFEQVAALEPATPSKPFASLAGSYSGHAGNATLQPHTDYLKFDNQLHRFAENKLNLRACWAP